MNHLFKKMLALFLVFAFLTVACDGNNSEEPEIPEIPKIPLENVELKKYLLENFDLDKDGFISVDEAALVKEINYFGCIRSSEGIQYFPNLKKLTLSHGCFSSIDLSKLTELEELDLTKTEALKSIDISHNLKLKTLIIDFCDISTLDVSKNLALESLSFDNHPYPDQHNPNNGLKSLKINPELKVLRIKNHKLPSIDFRGNKHLKELSCVGSNLMVSLDVSGSVLEVLEGNALFVNINGCTHLKTITCSTDKLDFSLCPNLENIYLSGLKELNISQSPLLKTLHCSHCFLSQLDLTGNPALRELKIESTVVNLDISNCFQLETIELLGSSIRYDIDPVDLSNRKSLKQITLSFSKTSGDAYESINLSGCKALENARIGARVKTLDLTDCSQLSELKCSGNSMTELILKGCSSLTDLSCGGNELTALDMSDCVKLINLHCTNNQLASLKVANATLINCANNKLKDIDVSKCTRLKELLCEQNAIKTLNLTGLSSLENLSCWNNPIQSLKLDDCKSLKTLNCAGCSLETLNIDPCKSLTHLYCRQNRLKPSLDISKVLTLTTIDCTKNPDLAELIISRNQSIKTLQKDPETKIVLSD